MSSSSSSFLNPLSLSFFLIYIQKNIYFVHIGLNWEVNRWVRVVAAWVHAIIGHQEDPNITAFFLLLFVVAVAVLMLPLLIHPLFRYHFFFFFFNGFSLKFSTLFLYFQFDQDFRFNLHFLIHLFDPTQIFYHFWVYHVVLVKGWRQIWRWELNIGSFIVLLAERFWNFWRFGLVGCLIRHVFVDIFDGYLSIRTRKVNKFRIWNDYQTRLYAG